MPGQLWYKLILRRKADILETGKVVSEGDGKGKELWRGRSESEIRILGQFEKMAIFMWIKLIL